MTVHIRRVICKVATVNACYEPFRSLPDNSEWLESPLTRSDFILRHRGCPEVDIRSDSTLQSVKKFPSVVRDVMWSRWNISGSTSTHLFYDKELHSEIFPMDCLSPHGVWWTSNISWFVYSCQEIARVLKSLAIPKTIQKSFRTRANSIDSLI